MNEKKKLQPKVRFREFTGENAPDWEQRKFRNFIVKSGAKNKNGENYPAYSVSNQLGLVLQSEQFDGSRLDNLDKTSYKIVYPDEFVYNPARINVGSIAFNNLEKIVIVSSLYVVLKISEKIDNKYILQYIKSSEFTKEVKRNTEGSVREYLFFENFCNVRFPYSINIKEQKKIGNLFERLDKLITLHQRKLELLEQLKNTLLSKMFPKSETNIPEIRFSGFTDSWKQRKLGEAGDFNPKCSLPKKFEYVDLESVDDTRLVSHRTEYIDNAPSRAQRLAKSGDIFYQTVRPYQKNNFLFNIADSREYVFSTGYAQIRPYGNSEYLMTLIQGKEFVRKVLNNCTGTSYPAINSKDLEKISIFIPKINEQERIGNLFQKIDKLITLNQRNLDNLKNMKQTLLNKMFV